MKKYQNLISGIIFLVIAIILFQSSFSIVTTIPGRLGAEFMPQVIAVIMAVLSSLLIIIDVAKLIQTKNQENSSFASFSKQTIINYVKLNYQIILMLSVVAIYIVLLKPLGFVFSTMIFLFTMMSIMSDNIKEKILLHSIVSIIASLSIYYLFRMVFYLYLPVGIYPF